MSSIDSALRQTPLRDQHLAAGGKLVAFAGWEMPVSYAGVKEEHLACRRGCGLFDVSHMGEIETIGPDAIRLLQMLLTNDVAAIEVGGAQYSCLCREDGGVLDDLFTYRLADEHYLTVTNASNHETDLEWFRTHADGFDVEVVDALSNWAMIAVQGPGARELLAGLADSELPPRMRVARIRVAGIEVLACGTGYTGEDGLELMVEARHAAELWRGLIDAGGVPCGLGARDSLRLEVCFHLYGNDLSTDRTPIEAGLGWCCKEQTGFIGADATARVRADGPAEVLVPFRISGSGIPRRGNPVLDVAGSAVVGEVSSGGYSPCLEAGIGMAYVRGEFAEGGSELTIDVRGRHRNAVVETKPLYKPGND